MPPHFLQREARQQSRRAKFVLHVIDRPELCDSHEDKSLTHKESGFVVHPTHMSRFGVVMLELRTPDDCTNG